MFLYATAFNWKISCSKEIILSTVGNKTAFFTDKISFKKALK
jgi:hypothetical protein